MPVLLLIENTTYEESTAALLAFYLLSIHLLLLFIRSGMRTSARSHASNADMHGIKFTTCVLTILV